MNPGKVIRHVSTILLYFNLASALPISATVSLLLRERKFFKLPSA
jgi:hypothetical protein